MSLILNQYQISGPSIPGFLVSQRNVVLAQGFLCDTVNRLHERVGKHESSADHHIVPGYIFKILKSLGIRDITHI